MMIFFSFWQNNNFARSNVSLDERRRLPADTSADNHGLSAFAICEMPNNMFVMRTIDAKRKKIIDVLTVSKEKRSRRWSCIS